MQVFSQHCPLQVSSFSTLLLKSKPAVGLSAAVTFPQVKGSVVVYVRAPIQ